MAKPRVFMTRRERIAAEILGVIWFLFDFEWWLTGLTAPELYHWILTHLVFR